MSGVTTPPYGFIRELDRNWKKDGSISTYKYKHSMPTVKCTGQRLNEWKNTYSQIRWGRLVFSSCTLGRYEAFSSGSTKVQAYQHHKQTETQQTTGKKTGQGRLTERHWNYSTRTCEYFYTLLSRGKKFFTGIILLKISLNSLISLCEMLLMKIVLDPSSDTICL